MKKGACGAHELVPIDHGYVLPDCFQDISFEWLYWPQARAPLGELLPHSRQIRSARPESSLASLHWVQHVQACNALCNTWDVRYLLEPGSPRERAHRMCFM